MSLISKTTINTTVVTRIGPASITNKVSIYSSTQDWPVNAQSAVLFRKKFCERLTPAAVARFFEGLLGSSRRSIVNYFERILKKPGSLGGTRRSKRKLSDYSNRVSGERKRRRFHVGSLASQLCRVGNDYLLGDGNS
jgi:hypothetical protein